MSSVGGEPEQRAVASSSRTAVFASCQVFLRSPGRKALRHSKYIFTVSITIIIIIIIVKLLIIQFGSDPRPHTHLPPPTHLPSSFRTSLPVFCQVLQSQTKGLPDMTSRHRNGMITLSVDRFESVLQLSIANIDSSSSLLSKKDSPSSTVFSLASRHMRIWPL